ncbi:thioredoxin-disulfide reductase, partial [bacterium 1XD42-8]
TYEVDNYPGMQGSSGFDMGMKFREHADTLGVRFAEEDVVSLDVKGDIKKVVTNKNEYKTKAIIIASGASHRKLNVPGEEELSGKGVSYCATCDGAFFRDKITAVVGGGDVAVEDAVFLARVCKKVYVIHRRDELRAAKSLQDVMLALDNVEMLWDSTVEEIVGSEKVKELVVENVKTKEKKTLQVDGVFIAVGIIPNSQMYASLVETDQAGYIVAGEDGATNVPGIYVAGDVRTKLLRQIVTAVSDGANAVTAISEYLMKHPNF